MLRYIYTQSVEFHKTCTIEVIAQQQALKHDHVRYVRKCANSLMPSAFSYTLKD